MSSASAVSREKGQAEPRGERIARKGELQLRWGVVFEVVMVDVNMFAN